MHNVVDCYAYSRAGLLQGHPRDTQGWFKQFGHRAGRGGDVARLAQREKTRTEEAGRSQRPAFLFGPAVVIAFASQSWGPALRRNTSCCAASGTRSSVDRNLVPKMLRDAQRCAADPGPTSSRPTKLCRWTAVLRSCAAATSRLLGRHRSSEPWLKVFDPLEFPPDSPPEVFTPVEPPRARREPILTLPGAL